MAKKKENGQRGQSVIPEAVTAKNTARHPASPHGAPKSRQHHVYNVPASSCAWSNPGPSAPPPLETDKLELMASVRAKIAAERSQSFLFVKRALFQMGIMTGAVVFDKWEMAIVATVYVMGTWLLCYGVYRQVMHVLSLD